MALHSTYTYTHTAGLPCRAASAGAEPGARLGVALTVPWDQCVSGEWQVEARRGEQHIMLYN